MIDDYFFKTSNQCLIFLFISILSIIFTFFFSEMFMYVSKYLRGWCYNQSNVILSFTHYLILKSIILVEDGWESVILVWFSANLRVKKRKERRWRESLVLLNSKRKERFVRESHVIYEKYYVALIFCSLFLKWIYQ